MKEIEVGFPGAGATEFDFIRLVQSGRVRKVNVRPDAKPRGLDPHQLRQLSGSHAAIVHLQCGQPRMARNLFGMTRDQVRDIAVHGAKVMRDEASKQPATDWHFQYSPETSNAELDFNLEVCEAVMEVLAPTPTTRSSSTCPPRSKRRPPTSTRIKSRPTQPARSTARSSTCIRTMTAARQSRRPTR